jgi:hypothetical protein
MTVTPLGAVARLRRELGKSDCRMKYVAVRPFADPAVAARKLLEIANATETIQDGRIFIETINGQFLEGGTPEEYKAPSPVRSLTAGCGSTSPEHA